MTVEELNVIITAQNSEFKRRIDEVNGRLNKMSQTAQKSSDKTYSVFKGLAGKVAALGIGKIIANSITEGMNAIESESLFEVSLGKYADSAREWSKKLSDSLGLDQYSLRKNVGTLFTMTQSMGIAKDSALSMSQNITQLAEDMASFYNITSDEAFTKLRSGLTGETEPLKQLGILVDETTIKQYAYKNGIAAVGDELTQTQKVMARYAAIMEQTSTAQGDLARTMDSPANQLRALKNDIKELMIDTGTSLMPTVSSLLSMARSGLEVVTPLITNAADGVNEVSQAIINASPQTKTLLTLTLASAVAIPAVTKAQMLLTLAQRGYSALLGILIPKQFTYATALKATAGWIGVIAGALAIFSLMNDANANVQETTKDAVNDLTAEKKAAEDAASGVDALADSMNGLGEAVTGGLAAVDKLNIAGGLNGGTLTGNLVSQIDLDNLAKASDLTGELQEQISGLKNVELPAFGEVDFSKTIESVEKGVSLLWSALFGAGNEQYMALKTLNAMVKKIFGDEWTTYWNDVGATVYNAFSHPDSSVRDQALAEIETWLTDVTETAENTLDKFLLGDVARAWNDFWKNVGKTAFEEQNGKFQDAKDVFEEIQNFAKNQTYDYSRDNQNATKAWDNLWSTVIDEIESSALKATLPSSFVSDYKQLLNEIEMQSYSYEAPDYSKAQVADTTASDYYRQQGLAAEQRKSEQRKISLNLHVNSFLDGERVAESVIQREISEAEASNDY